MFKTYLIVSILCLGLFFQGCAALEYLDGSSKDEINAFKNNKSKPSSVKKDSQIEMAKLKREIVTLKKENQRITDEKIYEYEEIREKNRALQKELEQLKEENNKIGHEKQALAEQSGTLQEKKERPSSESYNAERNIKKIKIKVLSGDGDIKSATNMTKKLRDIGYSISMIDSAPRSDFASNTVYFASSFQEEAKKLVPVLGSNSILKPLNWSSVYNIIIVTIRD